MNHLILIRHSLPEIDPTIPARQWNLSEIGRLRCKTLAEKIAPYSPNVLISSVEPKAVETAQILTRYAPIPFRILQGFHEHDRTGVEFVSNEQFEANLRDFFEHPNDLVLGRETANQVHERFSEALASTLKQHRNKTVGIVAHGTVTSLFVARTTGTDPFSFWRKLGSPSFVVFSLPDLKLVRTVEEIRGPDGE